MPYIDLPYIVADDKLSEVVFKFQKQVVISDRSGRILGLFTPANLVSMPIGDYLDDDDEHLEKLTITIRQSVDPVLGEIEWDESRNRWTFGLGLLGHDQIFGVIEVGSWDPDLADLDDTPEYVREIVLCCRRSESSLRQTAIHSAYALYKAEYYDRSRNNVLTLEQFTALVDLSHLHFVNTGDPVAELVYEAGTAFYESLISIKINNKGEVIRAADIFDK